MTVACPFPTIAVPFLWKTIVRHALFAGLLPIDAERGAADMDNLAAHKTIVPGRPLISPKDDVAAYSQAVATLLMSRERATAEMSGEDSDVGEREIAEDLAFREANGLPEFEAPGMSYRAEPAGDVDPEPSAPPAEGGDADE